MSSHPLLDDNPEYGLHGYQLHADMHSSGIFYLRGTFLNLFTKKGYIENGYVKLVVVSFKNNTEQLPIVTQNTYLSLEKMASLGELIFSMAI